MVSSRVARRGESKLQTPCLAIFVVVTLLCVGARAHEFNADDLDQVTARVDQLRSAFDENLEEMMGLETTGQGGHDSFQYFSPFDAADKDEWVDINRHLPFENQCRVFRDNDGFAAISEQLVKEDGTSIRTWDDLRERVKEVTGRDHIRILTSYAHTCCYKSMTKQCNQGLQTGGFDVFIAHAKNDMGKSWATRTADVLNSKRGAGFWSWKSEIVSSFLRLLNKGDYLVYSDAPTDWIQDAFKDWAYECTRLSEPWGVCLFALPRVLSDWTKRDTFVRMGCDTEDCYHNLNLLGGTHVWRVSDKALEFALKWRDAVADIHKVSQYPNVMGLPDIKGFRKHRHDQSCLSILAYQLGLKPFRDPSQYGVEIKNHYQDPKYPPWMQKKLGELVKRSEFYPQMLRHTRQRF